MSTEATPDSMLLDFPFLVPFLTIVITLIGIFLGFYYFKQKAKVETKSYELALENAALQKKREEVITAKELREENKKLAVEVKDTMLVHVGNIIGTLKADNELQKTILLSEINLMKKDYSIIRSEMVSHIENQQIINERMQKSIDFMNQFLWGSGSKSIPPYLEGEEETQEHKDKAQQGIFSEPDSSETQKTKDDKKQQHIEE